MEINPTASDFYKAQMKKKTKFALIRIIRVPLGTNHVYLCKRDKIFKINF